ncbi:RBR1 [Scenedesmus sp. PABB004]|nr:RBR1 [Scenedesmus sp. PABB004]
MARRAAESWMWQVYSHTRAASPDSLFTYFRGAARGEDLTADIINMVSAAVKAVLPPGGATLHALEEDGGAGMEAAACATSLYYTVAEHLLRQLFPLVPPATGAGRFKGLVKAPADPACHELVRCEEFHLPLVEVALHLVSLVAGRGGPDATDMLQRGAHAPSLWQACRSFQECFGADSPWPLPAELDLELQRMQDSLLDARALASGSQLFSILVQGGGAHFKPGDASLAGHVLQAYAHRAISRAQMAGWQVLQGALAAPEQPAAARALHEQCAWVMDRLLMEHLDLCFGQHMSVVVACVVYVVAKVARLSVTFQRITEVLARDGTPPDVFERAELHFEPVASRQRRGDVRTFYNTRFLPAVERSVHAYLQSYAAAGDAAAEEETAGLAPSGDAATPRARRGGRQPLARVDANSQPLAGALLPSGAAKAPGGERARTAPAPARARGGVVSPGLFMLSGAAPPPGGARQPGFSPARTMR